MAKKFGRRAKASGQDRTGLEADPRNMFGAPALPRQTHRPASSTPLAEYLDRGWPGVDPGYVVVPRSLAESMSLPWQQQLVNQLSQFHEAHDSLSWPIYRVVPSRYEYLVDLDEEQLAEAGYLVEIDSDGEMVYRERSGRKVEAPEDKRVLVPCLDPIVRRPSESLAAPQRIEPGGPAPAGGGQARRPAPPAVAENSARPGSPPPPPPPPPPPRPAAAMNIGPQPVWPTTRGAGRPPAEESAAPGRTRPEPAPGEQRAEVPAARPETPAQRPAPARQEAPAQAVGSAEAPVRQDGPAQAVAPAQGAPAQDTPAQRPDRDAAAPGPDTASSADAETPPRGIRLPVMEDELELRDDGTFGPTGEPTEIPYRYKR